MVISNNGLMTVIYNILGELGAILCRFWTLLFTATDVVEYLAGYALCIG
jgi:hypothetical protein